MYCLSFMTSFSVVSSMPLKPYVELWCFCAFWTSLFKLSLHGFKDIVLITTIVFVYFLYHKCKFACIFSDSEDSPQHADRVDHFIIIIMIMLKFSSDHSTILKMQVRSILKFFTIFSPCSFWKKQNVDMEDIQAALFCSTCTISLLFILHFWLVFFPTSFYLFSRFELTGDHFYDVCLFLCLYQ